MLGRPWKRCSVSGESVSQSNGTDRGIYCIEAVAVVGVELLAVTATPMVLGFVTGGAEADAAVRRLREAGWRHVSCRRWR